MASPKFPESLIPLKGYTIKVFSNDGSSIKGNLVDVKEDHLVLQDENGEFFYYHLHHIKSISKNTKNFLANVSNDIYLEADHLLDILQHCQYFWVTINCHNKQSVSGILSRVFEDHIILIKNEERILLQNVFIENVKVSMNKEEKALLQNLMVDENMQVSNYDSRSDFLIKDQVNESFNEDSDSSSEVLIINDEETESKLQNHEATNQLLENKDEIQMELLESKLESLESVSETNDSLLQTQYKEQSNNELVETIGTDFLQVVNQENSKNTELDSFSETYDQKWRQESFLLDLHNENNILLPVGYHYAFPFPSTDSFPPINGPLIVEEENIAHRNMNEMPVNNQRKSKRRKNLKLRRQKSMSNNDDLKYPITLTNEKESIHVDTTLSLEEKEKMMEDQYYSLMKQAEKNLKKKGWNHNQFSSLLKQAEKKYLELKRKRENRMKLK